MGCHSMVVSVDIGKHMVRSSLMPLEMLETGTNDANGFSGSDIHVHNTEFRQNLEGSTGVLPNKFVYTGSAGAQGFSAWQIAIDKNKYSD